MMIYWAANFSLQKADGQCQRIVRKERKAARVEASALRRCTSRQDESRPSRSLEVCHRQNALTVEETLQRAANYGRAKSRHRLPAFEELPAARHSAHNFSLKHRTTAWGRQALLHHPALAFSRQPPQGPSEPREAAPQAASRTLSPLYGPAPHGFEPDREIGNVVGGCTGNRVCDPERLIDGV